MPVSVVIEYNENENDFPLFMILESVENIQMNVFLAIDISSHLLDRVFKDLARIHLEFLSHPSNRIEMLDFSQLLNSPTSTLDSYSLDTIKHEHDEVHTLKSELFTSFRKYYEYKCNVWKQRLERQQNSIMNIKDERRKILNETILNKCIDSISHSRHDDGSFYLTHSNLHSSNVILDSKTFHVIVLIDWEDACFLPLASSCTLPKTLFFNQISHLSSRSTYYMNYQSRVKKYIEVLSIEERRLLSDSNSHSTINENMKSYLVDDSMFLI